MKGIHIQYTLLKNRNKLPSAWFVLLQLISSIYWKKYNGEMYLYCDKFYYEFIFKNKLNIFWKEVILIDDNEFIGIDTNSFWASSKINVIGKQNEPFVLIDNDLYLDFKIPEEFYNSDYSYSHREHLNQEIYPSPITLCKPIEYEFNKNFDFSIRPANCSILYFRDLEFAKEFAKESLDFMRDNLVNIKSTDFISSHMVFAEQRLLNVFGKYKRKKSKCLINDIFDPNDGFIIIKDHLDYENPGIFNMEDIKDKMFHLWGSKINANRDNIFRDELIKRLLLIFKKESNFDINSILDQFNWNE